MEFDLKKIISMIKSNGSFWNVVGYSDGTLDLKHDSDLSNILECGHSKKEYDIDFILKCGWAEYRYIELNENDIFKAIQIQMLLEDKNACSIQPQAE